MVYYQSKTNKDDAFRDLQEAFDRGLNLSDYEKIETTATFKPTIKKLIFGSDDYIIKNDVKYRMMFFDNIIAELSKKDKTPFQIGKAQIDAKIQATNKSDKADKKQKLEVLEAERKALFVKYEKEYKAIKPRKSKEKVKAESEVKK